MNVVTPRMPRALLFLALILFGRPTPGSAQNGGDSTSILYEVDLADRAHHLARIAVHFPERESGLEIRMSRSSPGRYALHEFAKNVYEVRAEDASGHELGIERVNPHEWYVAHTGRVVFRYTLFANRIDGTYSSIDRHHAHLNIPATFAWARDLDSHPIEVRFRSLPEDWGVSTQLFPTDDPAAFSAPNRSYFMDSPIEASNHSVHEWPLGSQQVRVALHHEGSPADADAFVERVKSIVQETVAVFGEVPEFETGGYTFLADYLTGAAGDGMEHRNSTVLTSPHDLDSHMIDLLGTVAHEFVHAWNIERLRPRSLEPFSFERANMSGELWFGEGFTSYYDDLLLKRASIINLDRFAERLAGPINAVLTTPSRQHRSPVQMSQQAPFVDAASWIDPTNWQNNFLSYYTYGAALGAGFDLWLRTEHGKSLDQWMQLLWREHGKPEIAYTLNDLESSLGRLIDDPDEARTVFERYVHGSELPDYESLLDAAGLRLRYSRPYQAVLGKNDWEASDEGLRVASPVLETSPLYPADVIENDVLLSLNGKRLHDVRDLRRALARLSPGDQVEIRFVEGQGDVERISMVVLAFDDEREIVPIEHLGREVGESVRAFRDQWLSTRVNSGETGALHTHCHVCGRTWPGDFEFCPIDGSLLELKPMTPASPRGSESSHP